MALMVTQICGRGGDGSEGDTNMQVGVGCDGDTNVQGGSDE